jgi:phage terminase large subunit-like protein
MTSLLEGPSAAGPDLLGAQTPRLTTVPDGFLSSSGQEAVELAALAGLQLDPWQQLVLDQGLGEREDGSWSAFEVAVIVARQNGKGAIIEARELAGLFLLGERLILHSAHEFKTSIVAFKRIESLISNCDHLRKRVARVRRTTGEEAIELRTGQVLRFLARSGGSGRGFTGDCNVLDEAMILGDDAMSALMPTMSAVRNPQIWYLGSAGIGPPSVQLARLRRRAEKAQVSGVPDPSLAFFEWSIDAHLPECREGCTAHDDPGAVESWAKANPALGIRITAEHVARERLSMGAAGFAQERLSVGDYPSDDIATWEVVSKGAWEALAAPAAPMADPVAFAVDMTPERSASAIAVAGVRPDGRMQVEIVDHRSGTGWVGPRIRELIEKWRPCAVVIDAAGPAGSLITALEADGIEIVSPTGRQVAQACGQFYDAVVEDQLRHPDAATLNAALAGAKQRSLGDAWAWARKATSVDLSPLVAATNALWGHATRAHLPGEADPMDNIW